MTDPADVTVVVFTDGRRDYIERTIASFDEQVTGRIAERIIHDDSGDPANREWLADLFPDWHLIHGERGRLGFGGAVRNAWSYLAGTPDGPRFVWHLEDDFVTLRPVDLNDLAAVLDAHPHIAQIALLRQAWNAAERAAGGVVELNPSAYLDSADDAGRQWLQHRQFWTTNPSLYRRSLCARGWPRGAESEGRFGGSLFDDPDVWCAYWGARDSGQWVDHVGLERAAGAGY
jgi:hypothetical protein